MPLNLIRGVVLSIALLLLLTPVYASPIDVSHPVYPFLRRLELRGYVTPGFLGSLPLSKLQVKKLLRQARTHSDAMQAWETFRLEFFLEEFGYSESNQVDSQRFKRIRYRDSSFQVGVSAASFNGGYIHDSIPRAQSHGFGTLSAEVAGTYKEKFQFLSSAGIGQERSLHKRLSENYDPQRGLPYNTDRAGKGGLPRTVGTFDTFRTLVGYEDDGVRFDFGSDWNQWGPGIWQQAFLSQTPWFWVQDSLPPSDSVGFAGSKFPGRHQRGFRSPGESAPMTQLRLVVRLGRVSYTKVIAQRTGLYKDSLAHMVAHRLEFRPWKFLGLGIQEMVLTAGRPLDWTYMVPLVPIKYAEHQLGDRDNIAIGLDAEVLLFGWRVYGELFLDDFSGFDLNFWGAKYAYTFGFETAGLPFPASRFQFEFAHVEPWVFTHNTPDGQMNHFGALIGSSLPANSQVIHTALLHAVHATVDLRFEYAFMQHDLLSRGSGLFDLHDNQRDGTQKTFLGGTVEKRQTFLAGGTWKWHRFTEFHGSAGYLHVRDWKSRPGVHFSSPILAGELTLRY